VATSSPEHPKRPHVELHRARAVAESFGIDAQGYDRARPPYPDALVAQLVAESPGSSVLDVGCGTGIAARQFQNAGCVVLGVEPDPRMAELAHARGLEVEVATFESWQPYGRMFDLVIAAQSWHWIDPVDGALKAAEVLSPGGRLAIFGHVFEPPAAVAQPFAAAFRRVAPDSPFSDQPARRPIDVYQALYAKLSEAIRQTGRFAETDQRQFDWEQPYTRKQWLELLPTTGGLTQLSSEQTREILDAVGDAIDSLGGSFIMQFVTLAVVAALAV
jgi:SAM-dependent methyltransferase